MGYIFYQRLFHRRILCQAYSGHWHNSVLCSYQTRDPISLPAISSVQSSCSVVFNSLWPHESQHSRPPCPSPTPGIHPNPCPLSRRCHPVIPSPSPPAPNPSQRQGLSQWVNYSHEVASVLEFHPQHQSFQWIFRTDFPAPSFHDKYKRKNWKQWQIFSSWGLKSLWMVTAVMKTEDDSFLAGKLWQT